MFYFHSRDSFVIIQKSASPCSRVVGKKYKFWISNVFATLISFVFYEHNAPEKKFGPFCHFGTLRSIFPIFIFVKFLIFPVFRILNNNRSLNCNMHLKADIKTFNLRCQWTLYDQSYPRYMTVQSFVKK